jgi:hypothetical protein
MGPNSESLPFVNLVLKRAQDSVIVKVASSRESGQFEFLESQANRFFIEASYVGMKRLKTAPFDFQPDRDFQVGSLTFEAANVDLKEVSVIGTKPFVTIQPDKLVVNVDNNPLMINSNAFEVLQKSPGVFVNQDEQIFLQGKSGLMVYVDGRQSPLNEKDLANWLKTIPSGQIESIEIITNPSARYDAAGNAGIINIRLKKSQKKGLNGSFSSGASLGLGNEENNPRTNHNLNLNYGLKNFNLFGSYGYDYVKSWSFMNFDRVQGGEFFNQRTNTWDRRQAHNLKSGFDWAINQQNSLGLTFDMNLNASRLKATSGNLISEETSLSPKTFLDASNAAQKSGSNGNININHVFKDTSGLEITADANAGWYLDDNATNQPNFYRNKFTDNSVEDRSFGLQTKVNILIFTQKVDVEKKKGKSIFGFGAKLSNVLTDNDFSLFDRSFGQNEKDLDQSSTFSYTERVSAGYFSFRHLPHPKWTIQAGLRMEHTYSKGNLSTIQNLEDKLVVRDYFNWFPSGGITWNLNKTNALSLNYSRRVDRPVYRFLNPFQYKLDELSYEQGNPKLNPQFTHNFQLSHTLFSMITSSMGYSVTDDFFARVIDSSQNRTFLTRRNLARVQTYSFNLGSPLPIRNWWNGFLNFTLNHQLYEANFGEGKKLNLEITFYTLFLQNSISLPRDFAFQFSGSYTSPSVWGGTFRNRYFWFAEAGFTKKIWNKTATISLSLTDVFLSQRWRGNSDFGGVNITAWGGFESRMIKAGLVWNFGKSDWKPNRRKLSNQEERSRLRGE